MNVYDLVVIDREEVTLDQVLLEPASRLALYGLIKEHRYINELSKYGLPINNKLLLHGASGCGKTTTAKAIANALGRRIHILNLSTIVSSRIGETSQQLKAVFDKSSREMAVLFLDEFDQIGKARGNDDKDVGEMRRLVNTLIQLIDYYPQHTLLICATNHPEILDKALLRRFQLRIGFEMPDKNELDTYYDMLLAPMPGNLHNIERRYNLSFAEVRDYAYTCIKSRFIEELEEVNKSPQHTDKIAKTETLTYTS